MNSRNKILFFLLISFCCILFISCITIVLLEPKNTLDLAFYTYLIPYNNNLNNEIMLFFTRLGNDYSIITGYIILLLLSVFILKNKQHSYTILFVSISTLLWMYALKSFFARDRFEDPLFFNAIGYSFPSGHALNSVVFFGMIIFFVLEYINHIVLKRVLVTICICLPILIGLSRIYIRVHYLTDVLAGLSFGIIWLYVSLTVFKKYDLIKKGT